MKNRIDDMPWDDDLEFCYVRERTDWWDVICTTLSVIGAIGGAVFFILEAPI